MNGDHQELERRVRERTAELAEANEALRAEVAERKRAEQAQRLAALEERNRIARDIHDTLAQTFTGILMQLEAATRFLDTRPEQTRSCIARAHELSREGLMEARRSITALHPEAARHGDLSAALARIAERMTAGTPVGADVQTHGVPYALPPERRVDLLRIGQEALTNALRHAQAGAVMISVTYEPHQVTLRVRDDGRGFDPRHPAGGDGLGLIGMRQRAERIGGRLAIASRPGGGAEVAVVVPIADAPVGTEEL